MPLVRNTDDWAAVFRKQVRKLGKGWTVRESPRGQKVTLKVRENKETTHQPLSNFVPSVENYEKIISRQKEESVTLEFAWREDQAGDCYTRIRNIFALVAKENYSLKQAAEIAEGKAPKLIEQLDWSGAINRFKSYKTEFGTSITLRTWNKNYFLSQEEITKKADNLKGKMKEKTIYPVLNNALELLKKGSVNTPEDLIDQCVKQWASGSRSRQIAVRNLAQFLKYCVSREKFPVQWMPPTDLKHHIGEISKESKRINQKGDAVEDQALIDLIESIPDERWAFAVKILVELGLRPVELMHLEVKKDPKTKEHYWHCCYEKKSGGGSTEERKLYALKLKDSNGVTQEWDLMNQFEKRKIKLPEFEKYTYGVADALKNYLTRKYSIQSKKWFELKRQEQEQGRNFVIYSFRHSYSLRGHRLNIDGGSMATAMGHNYKTHCQAYTFASKSGVDAAFNLAKK